MKRLQRFILIYNWNRTKAKQYLWQCKCQPGKFYGASEHPLRCEWCGSIHFFCRRLGWKDYFYRALKHSR